MVATLAEWFQKELMVSRSGDMANVIYEKDVTALLVVDPYNDFISEGGKVWDRIRAVAEANNCVPHMLEVLNAARQASLRVFYALHHRYRPGDYETWKYIAPISKGSVAAKDLRIRHVGWRDPLRIRAAPGRDRRHGTLVFQGLRQHRFRFDLQLKKHGIHQIIVIGLIAHTCIEATVRFAAELGYDATMVKDATADYSDNEMRAALDINMPNYASVVTTKEVVDAISSL